MKTKTSFLSFGLSIAGSLTSFAATGPNVAITSPASGFSSTLSNITGQGTSSGVAATVASVKVNFVAATSTNGFTN